MQTIIVTGASRGIGQAVVQGLRADGVRVVGVARSAAPMQSMSRKQQPGHGPFEFVVGDIRDSDVLKTAVQMATSQGHSLVGLVLNAAMLELARVKDLDKPKLVDQFSANVLSQCELIALALPALREAKGRVVLVTSGIADHPQSGWAMYAASKAAMNVVLACLAQEEPAVTCMAIKPGIVNTGMVAQAASQAAVMDQNSRRWLESVTKSKDFLDPAVPGGAIAKIVQRAPPSLSGSCLSFDDPKLKDIL